MNMNLIVLAAWPTDVNGWVTLISLIVGLVAAIIALIPTIIKLVSALKELVKNKDWTKILVAIKSAAVTAEASGKSGADKKQMVIDSVKAFCKTIDVEVDDALLEQISTEIDKLITEHNALTEANDSTKTSK